MNITISSALSILWLLKLGMDRFHFFEKTMFRYENNDEKTKNYRFFNRNRFKKTVVFKTIGFRNNRFYKIRRFVNEC